MFVSFKSKYSGKLKLLIISWIRKLLKWLEAHIKSLVMVGLLILVFYNYVWKMKLPPDQPSIICSFGTGRLGNQMSSFATLWMFAKLYGYSNLVTKNQSEMLEFYFESAIKEELHVLEEEYRSYYFDIFGFSLSRLSWLSPWEALDSIEDNFNYSLISSDKFLKGEAINGGHYPNEVRFFHQKLPEIRKLFRLQKRFVMDAEEKLVMAKASVGASQPVFVAVHIRRGDYGEHLEHLYHLPLLDESYFSQAIRFYQNKYSSVPVIFVVVSDDLSWARRNIHNSNIFFLGNDKVLKKDIHNPLKSGEDIGEDLALLAACNHTIMSYGTFGMWGSLLAGGQVVLPSSFLLTKEGKELKASPLLQSGDWHVIEVPPPVDSAALSAAGPVVRPPLFLVVVLWVLLGLCCCSSGLIIYL